MTMKPPKNNNLLATIKECIEQKKYTHTEHAFRRHKERRITLAEVVYVLLNGYEEKNKTRFNDNYNVWNYAIRGKTKLDQLDVRIIVSFDSQGMLIITVMHVGSIHERS